MMPYKYTKAMVRSSESDTNFFDIVAVVFKWNTLTPYLFKSVYIVYK